MAGKTRKTRKSRGFTLSELLVAIGVLALVALIATPGLGEYLRDCRRAATLDMLTHAVHAARAAAAALGVRATLCGTMDGRSCSRLEDWSDALLVLPDPAEAEAPPIRLLRLDAGRTRQTVRSNRSAIEIEPLSPSATTATVTVCDDRGSRAARAMIISRTGRPRISDRDASGRVLACP